VRATSSPPWAVWPEAGIGLALLHRLAAAAGAAASALLQFLEAEFVVFLRLADRFLHLQELEAHLLDPAVQLAQLLFELLDAHFSTPGRLHVDDGRVPLLADRIADMPAE
jgi:hypothetical protein